MNEKKPFEHRLLPSRAQEILKAAASKPAASLFEREKAIHAAITKVVRLYPSCFVEDTQ